MCLNFSFLFHSLSWRAATLRRQTAYEALAISVELATGQPFPVFTARYLTRPLPMRASGWNFGEINFSGTCGPTNTLPCRSKGPRHSMALVVSSAFGMLSGGRLLGKRLANMVLPAPGEPILIKVGFSLEN